MNKEKKENKEFFFGKNSQMYKQRFWDPSLSPL